MHQYSANIFDKLFQINFFVISWRFLHFFVTHLSKVNAAHPRRLLITWQFYFIFSPSSTLALLTISWRPTTVKPIPCQHASSMSSSHRIHTNWQRPLSGVHSVMMEKLSQPGEGGVHAHPLSLYLPSRTELWCTLQLRGQIHFPYFYSTPLCTLQLFL